MPGRQKFVSKAGKPETSYMGIMEKNCYKKLSHPPISEIRHVHYSYVLCCYTVEIPLAELKEFFCINYYPLAID